MDEVCKPPEPDRSHNVWSIPGVGSTATEPRPHEGTMHKADQATVLTMPSLGGVGEALTEDFHSGAGA